MDIRTESAMISNVPVTITHGVSAVPILPCIINRSRTCSHPPDTHHHPAHTPHGFPTRAVCDSSHSIHTLGRSSENQSIHRHQTSTSSWLSQLLWGPLSSRLFLIHTAIYLHRVTYVSQLTWTHDSHAQILGLPLDLEAALAFFSDSAMQD